MVPMQQDDLSKVIERVRQEAEAVVLDPEEWLRLPNEHLGGKLPIEVVQEGREDLVRDPIEPIKHGMPT